MPAVAMDMETLNKLLDIIEEMLINDLPKLICHAGLDPAPSR
jgi:hypothetical protein